jgi:hypothetical protein
MFVPLTFVLGIATKSRARIVAAQPHGRQQFSAPEVRFRRKLFSGVISGQAATGAGAGAGAFFTSLATVGDNCAPWPRQ